MLKASRVEIIKTIENALELKQGAINENTQAKDIENWDSLGQLSILVALNKIFDGKIAGISEMAEADSIEKIFNILQENKLLN